MYQKLKKKFAFTLVELIIVIAIITLLASIIVVVIDPQSIFINSRNSQRAQDIQTLQTAVARYLAESPITGPSRDLNDFTGFNLLYSDATTQTAASCPGGINGSSLTDGYPIDSSGSNILNISNLLNKGYLPKVPKDPSGNPYMACLDTDNGNRMVIFSPYAEKGIPVYTSSTTTTQNIAIVPRDGGNGKDGAVTIAANQNFNLDLQSNGRNCADGINFSVTALTSNTATLSTNPNATNTCLSVNDEVLLLNQFGTASTKTNLGNFETFKISSINTSTNTITFNKNKTKFYGDGASDDTNIGTASTNQRVILERVPNYTNVTINNGVTLTANGWDGTKGGVLFFRSNGSITNNGTIDVTAKGFREAEGPGPGQNNGGCGCSCGNAAGGGGYGGVGGYGNGPAGGYQYGKINKPINLGSGGNNAGCGGGGYGGGAIYFMTSGTFTNNGFVLSNGGNAGTAAGGGAGGSIYISADTITGAGTITANGGNGGDNNCYPCSRYGGSGSGGRVVLSYLTANSFSGTLSANTGASSGNIGENGTLVSLNSSSNDAIVNTSQVWRPDVEGQTISFHSITIQNNSTITIPGYYTTGSNGIGLILDVTNFSLSAGSLINMNGLGYAGAVGNWTNGTGSGAGNGNNCGGGNSASGAGYGGTGGSGNGPVGGSTYGSASAPLDLGSGGGASCGNGGNGGGALKVNASGTATINGTITANGIGGGTMAGGGSGGSIWINAGTINGNGTLNANGGDGGDWAGNRWGGGGGGGRIALIKSVSNTFTGTTTVNAGSSHYTMPTNGTITTN